MIDYDLDAEHAILHVQPKSALVHETWSNSPRRSILTSRRAAVLPA
jgi:hypothetical protein